MKGQQALGLDGRLLTGPDSAEEVLHLFDDKFTRQDERGQEDGHTHEQVDEDDLSWRQGHLVHFQVRRESLALPVDEELIESSILSQAVESVREDGGHRGVLGQYQRVPLLPEERQVLSLVKNIN